MKMGIVLDDLWLCDDCTIAAVNGDFPEDVERDAAVTAGLESLGPHIVPDFDSETSDGIEEFACRSCDCCDSGLAGGFHRFAILGRVDAYNRPLTEAQSQAEDVADKARIAAIDAAYGKGE